MNEPRELPDRAKKYLKELERLHGLADDIGELMVERAEAGLVQQEDMLDSPDAREYLTPEEQNRREIIEGRIELLEAHLNWMRKDEFKRGLAERGIQDYEESDFELVARGRGQTPLLRVRMDPYPEP